MKRVCVFILLFFFVNPAFAGERILAFTPHACEILYAIGAGDEIVGAVDYCDYPQAAKALPRVGTFNRINVEAALVLKPTIAIVLNAQTPGVEKLRALGVKIVPSYPKRVLEVLSDIRRIGEITGHVTKAEQLANKLQSRLDKMLKKVGDRQLRVFYETWSDPLLTAGKTTFIHDVLKSIGLRNIFGSVKLEAPRVNMESVIAAKPQLVIVPAENRDVSARKMFWRKWLGENVQVISVNPDLLHRPGPRLFDGMEELVTQLNRLYNKGLKLEK